MRPAPVAASVMRPVLCVTITLCGVTHVRGEGRVGDAFRAEHALTRF